MTKSALPKWFVTSRGVMGPLLAIVAVALAAKGVEVSPETQALVLDQLDAIVLAGMALLGSLLGVWGRVKAKGDVTLYPKGKP